MPSIALLALGKSAGTTVLLLSVALLMIVWLRSIRVRMGSGSAKHDSCIKARVFIARAEISQIDSANWIHKHRTARRIPRRSLALSDDERAWLKSITANQALAGAE